MSTASLVQEIPRKTGTEQGFKGIAETYEKFFIPTTIRQSA